MKSFDEMVNMSAEELADYFEEESQAIIDRASEQNKSNLCATRARLLMYLRNTTKGSLGNAIRASQEMHMKVGELLDAYRQAGMLK